MTHEFDRTDALLADIRDLVRHAGLITARGRAVFFDRADRTQQLAGKAIVIDLQTAVERLPEDYRDQHPEVAWAELRAMRNYLAQDYANTDYQIVWNALVTDFPRLLVQLGIG
ncbi:DUF86 domain-containing protein [Cryobacterium sp. HLT2-28]|uniref:HepT-like ribonuclease domain-containing protein n=1 Tax=Cryobacterium sp. HLT2-28 TaxID=1259146 RepID=UPI001068FD6F|nr:HepT-like ribonuclease domain-containing protein [Cryobacterium sp. HLT2-28]TFB90064.1 DUF86 domain-containing protein [Cryobacterium sp. HLT2-28]